MTPRTIDDASEPLRGACVLVTRSAEQAPELSAALRKLGADVVEAPAIRLAAPRSWARLDRTMRSLEAGEYAWLVLTSANGVRFFAERLDALGISRHVLRRAKIAAVGPGTGAALKKVGARADLMPGEFTTEAIGREFPRGSGRILLARADRTEAGLEETLGALGWSCERVVLYRLLRAGALENEVKRRLAGAEIDVVTFASGGTVRAFAKLYRKPLPVEVRVACIGPITARVAAEIGIRVDAIASEHTISGLARAAAEAWSGPSPAR